MVDWYDRVLQFRKTHKCNSIQITKLIKISHFGCYRSTLRRATAQGKPELDKLTSRFLKQSSNTWRPSLSIPYSLTTTQEHPTILHKPAQVPSTLASPTLI